MPHLQLIERVLIVWIFTETGFVSVVRHHSESGVVVVRARDQESLEGLMNQTDAPLMQSPYNDYPYRVHIRDEEFQAWLAGVSSHIDYTNFKDRVHDTRGSNFVHSLMGVWNIMHDVEDRGARK